MFKKTKVATGVALALGGAIAATSLPVLAQDAQRIEITGSRIKRVDAEGALPVTVIDRAQLEASGAVTVADFARTLTFASFGNYRPQSGSSFGGYGELDLRGLGRSRTLVLVDGRRVAKAPQVGDGADLNSIPMAAVERVEVLTDGASSIYGSDAIGGVVNFILRKDFDGGYLRYGETKTGAEGGDRTEISAVFGMSSDKGRFLVGAQASTRDIIWQRDAEVPVARGASSYGNNFFASPGLGGFLGPVGGTAEACDAVNNGGIPGLFYFAGGRCRFDFTGTAADEAATKNKALFARGEVQINADWSAYFNGSVNRNTTFGRYAPVPGEVLIEPGSTFDLLGRSEPYYLAHRFAAAGNRDNFSDTNVYDTTVGVKGVVAGWDLEFGVRKTVAQFYNIGRGYIIETLARAAINAGTYDPLNPYSADPLVLASFTATTGQDSKWDQTELFASAGRELFAMGGGNAAVFVGMETRKEIYADIYDSLSEGGVVLGSSGNSAGGSREVHAIAGEMLLPFTKTLEGSISARYEKYSDYGSDFSPKVSMAFKPTPSLKLRASFGRGFMAPTLPALTQKPSFSADSIIDLQHCLADGNDNAFCTTQPLPTFQINGLRIANPELSSEKSTQYAVGAVWDVTPSLSLKVDFWDVKIDDAIVFVAADELVNRENGTSAIPIPAGLSVTRDASGFITQVVSGSTNEGKLARQGLDFNVVFSHKYASLGGFRHELQWSHLLKASTNGVSFEGDFIYPKDRATLSNTWNLGPFSATWNLNYIGKHGSDGTNIGSYITHDVQGSWATPIKGVKLTLGVLNAGGKLPTAATPPNSTRQFSYELYDQYKEQFYGRIEARF